MKRLVISAVIGLALIGATFCVNASELDDWSAVIAECEAAQQTAHCMAEDARALGYGEDSTIITTASQHWWDAQSKKLEYQAKIDSYAEKPSVTCETLYTAKQFKSKGAIRWNGYRWTWYSQRVLPGKGLKIPGRCVDSNGYVCDGDGYICLASKNLAKETVVKTPLGKYGKVYDRCGIYGTLDVYVNW